MNDKLPWALLIASWLFFSAPKEKLNQLIVSKNTQKLPWILLILTYSYLLSPERIKQKIWEKLGFKPKRLLTAKYPKPPRVESVEPFVMPAEKTSPTSVTPAPAPEAVTKPVSSKRLTEYSPSELLKTLDKGAEPPHRFKSFGLSKALFFRVLPLDDWQTQQTLNGVTISMLHMKEQNLPFIRGDGVISGYSCEEISGVIVNPVARKTWDPRFDSANPLEFFTNGDSLVHSCQKGTWPVAGRDFVTVMSVDSTADRLDHILASVEDSLAPAPGSNGCVRGELMIAGWHLKRTGKDVNISYIVHVEPNGTVPTSLVKMVQQQTPMCVKGVKDYIESNGTLPYLFQNNKYTTSDTVKFTNKDSRLDQVTLEFNVENKPGVVCGQFYIGFGKSFIGGVNATAQVVRGNAKICTKKIDPATFGEYVTSNTKFILQFWVEQLDGPIAVKFSAKPATNAKITVNGAEVQ